jgi:hypothetical protein
MTARTGQREQDTDTTGQLDQMPWRRSQDRAEHDSKDSLAKDMTAGQDSWDMTAETKQSEYDNKEFRS